MKKYRVSVVAYANVYLGEFEAENQNKAIEMAMEQQGSDNVNLCYQCSREVGDLTLSCEDEDIMCEEVEEEYFED